MIVESTIIEDAPQKDGRRYVTELHVDDEGKEHRVMYLAESKANVEEMLPARAAQISAQIEERRNTPPPEPEYKLSEIEAAYTKATQKGEVNLDKLKEELSAAKETGAIAVDVEVTP